jgi:hypothetical protein
MASSLVRRYYIDLNRPVRKHESRLRAQRSTRRWRHAASDPDYSAGTIHRFINQRETLLLESFHAGS